MRRLRRVVATVTTVAVLGLSAACGGDNPTPSAAPSASPSPTKTSAATAPEVPEAAAEKTRDGAVAAVRYFLAAMAYAGDTGEVDQFRASFRPSCTKCEAIASGIERTYGAGGSIEGGSWQPKRFKVYNIANDIAYVDAAVDYDRQNFVAKRGAPVDDVPAQKNVLKAFQLKWDGSWRVGALDPEA